MTSGILTQAMGPFTEWKNGVGAWVEMKRLSLDPSHLMCPLDTQVKMQSAGYACTSELSKEAGLYKAVGR